MSTLLEHLARRLFRQFNRFMVLMWRLGIGPAIGCYPPLTGRFLVIGHTGRRSGRRRYTPLNYARVDGELYCTAGFGAVSDWYRNVLVKPQISLWLDNQAYQARIEEVSEHPQRLAIMREVLRGSGLVAPLVGVDPNRLSDKELDRRTTAYRLLRIRPLEPDTTADRPGNLAWLWLPFAATLLAAGLLLRRTFPRR